MISKENCITYCMEIFGDDNLKALKKADNAWVSNCGNDYEIERFRVKFGSYRYHRSFIMITNDEYCAISATDLFPMSFENLAWRMSKDYRSRKSEKKWSRALREFCKANKIVQMKNLKPGDFAPDNFCSGPDWFIFRD